MYASRPRRMDSCEDTIGLSLVASPRGAAQSACAWEAVDVATNAATKKGMVFMDDALGEIQWGTDQVCSAKIQVREVVAAAQA